MSLIQDLNRSYEEGEFDTLKSSLLPFLKSNRQKLQDFMDVFCEKNPHLPLDNVIKIFILSYNMPFDMKNYMEGQSEAMTKDIGPEIESTRRRELISEWVRDKAAKFREHSMLQQIFCFEKMKNEIVPLIECDLNLRQPKA